MSDSSESVFRLIYHSHSLIDPGERSSALSSIFQTARHNNRQQEITGALLVTETAFVQALEGPEADVRSLYETIQRDGRHDHVDLLQQSEGPRTFGRWAMAEISDPDRPDRRLVSHPRSGEIVAMGKDPSITPGQEEVLSFMRDAASHGAARRAGAG